MKTNPFATKNLFKKLLLVLVSKVFNVNLFTHYAEYSALRDLCSNSEKLLTYYKKHSCNNENLHKKNLAKLQKLDKRLEEAGFNIRRLEGTIKKLRKDKKKLIEYKHKCKLLAQYNDMLNELYDKAAFVACLPEAIRNDVLPQYHRPTVEKYK